MPTTCGSRLAATSAGWVTVLRSAMADRSLACSGCRQALRSIAGGAKAR
jgi:hypothetical protein